MFPWILVVLLTLPNGAHVPTVIAGFKDQATCENIRTHTAFQNRDNTKAPSFCRRSYRA